MSHWMHMAGHAGHAANHGSKLGAVLLIVVGFFMAPLLIGIPLMILGFVKLFSGKH